MEPGEDASEQISTEAAVIAAAAEECVATGAPLEVWRRRVMAAIGRVGTRLPVFRSGHRPKFFPDVEVREHLIGLHREVTIEAAVADCRARFGEARAPSKSAVQRFWRYLDELQQGTKKR